MKLAKSYFFTVAKSAVVIIFTAVTCASCKKEKTDSPLAPQLSPAIGYWVGSYTTTGMLGSSNYAMLIKTGGTARIYDLSDKTDTSLLSPLSKVNAVWTLSGMTLQTTYVSGTKTVNTTATLNATYTKMAGTWAFDGVVKGNISLDR